MRRNIAAIAAAVAALAVSATPAAARDFPVTGTYKFTGPGVDESGTFTGTLHETGQAAKRSGFQLSGAFSGSLIPNFRATAIRTSSGEGLESTFLVLAKYGPGSRIHRLDGGRSKVGYGDGQPKSAWMGFTVIGFDGKSGKLDMGLEFGKPANPYASPFV
jgi:hypothetical protein